MDASGMGWRTAEVDSQVSCRLCTRIVAAQAAVIAFLLATLAEREGFEPPIPLRVCRISSAVLSTTQPPLRVPTGASGTLWRARRGSWCGRYRMEPRPSAQFCNQQPRACRDRRIRRSGQVALPRIVRPVSPPREAATNGAAGTYPRLPGLRFAATGAAIWLTGTGACAVDFAGPLNNSARKVRPGAGFRPPG
jgi:hypothetical protein